MGGIPHDNGITLNAYDITGTTVLFTDTYTHCWLTGQPAEPGVGSQDWLKEVYLAKNQKDLYSLLREFPPNGTLVPFTSAASKNVLIHYRDENTNTFRRDAYLSAIGEGQDTTVTHNDGSTEPLREIDTLHVTQGDAYSDDTNHLHQKFLDSSIALSFLAIKANHKPKR